MNRMRLFRQILFGCAVVCLVAFSLPYAYYRQLAVNQDSNDVSLGYDTPPCSYPIGSEENLAIKVSQRVIRETDSLVFEALVSNHDYQDSNCEVEVSLTSAGLKIIDQTEQTITIPPGKYTAKVSWVLEPMKQGSHPITMKAGLQSGTRGVTINNVYGVSPQIWKILTLASSLIVSGVALKFLMGLRNIKQFFFPIRR